MAMSVYTPNNAVHFQRKLHCYTCAEGIDLLSGVCLGT